MPPRAPSARVFATPPGFLCPSYHLNHQPIRTFKSIMQPAKPSRFDQLPHLPRLGASPAAALERKSRTLPLRTGALAIKKGMTAIYDPATSKRIPCTVLQLDRCQVTGHKTRADHGYWAVQVGSGTKEARNVTRAERGNAARNEVPLKRDTTEFRVKDATGLAAVGSIITADVFTEGQFVDARAISKGHGFTGVMKRWGFHGQDASHGVSLTHRSMGSSGGGQGSGSRVHPGKKMAGRMGGEWATVQNLRVLKVDAENGVVVVAGPVPGPKLGMVKVQDAIKKPRSEVTEGVGMAVHDPFKQQRIARMEAEA